MEVTKRHARALLERQVHERVTDRDQAQHCARGKESAESRLSQQDPGPTGEVCFARTRCVKKRNPGTIVTWGVSVLDLATLADHPLAETRNVDDQVEWLDNQRVMYGLPQDAGGVTAAAYATPGTPVLGGQASIQTNTWAVRADGTGTPKELISGAWSTIPVRG